MSKHFARVPHSAPLSLAPQRSHFPFLRFLPSGYHPGILKHLLTFVFRLQATVGFWTMVGSRAMMNFHLPLPLIRLTVLGLLLSGSVSAFPVGNWIFVMVRLGLSLFDRRPQRRCLFLTHHNSNCLSWLMHFVRFLGKETPLPTRHCTY